MGEQVLVTGGSGFLGSAFVRRAVSSGQSVINVDVGTYAADGRRLADLREVRPRTERVDVASEVFGDLVRRIHPSLIVHFAAQTHVTRGEDDDGSFRRSNVDGTRGVLSAAEESGVGLVVHVSTDEIYGPCTGRPFQEDDPIIEQHPATSTYAKTKWEADAMARSWSPKVPVIVARLSNCFGPWQHPEKAFARWTARAVRKQRVPVWGDGMQVRDWMHSEDACAGLELLVERGTPGTVYNVAPEGGERTNLRMARDIAAAAGNSRDAVYLTEYDRPQHDRRYAIDATRIRALGWRPARSLDERLSETVDWYRAHVEWWDPLIQQAESLYADEAERIHEP